MKNNANVASKKIKTMDSKTVDKFFNSTVKPSDFKYKWTIVRWKNDNDHKVLKDLEELGMIEDYCKVIDGKLRMNSKRANEIKAKYLELRAKHASKSYTYCLTRQCIAVDGICKALAARGKRYYAKIQKTGNYLIMLEKARDEHKKDRKFSSLSAMQKYADKNSLGIDVYSLWEVEKKRKHFLENTKGKKD